MLTLKGLALVVYLVVTIFGHLLKSTERAEPRAEPRPGHPLRERVHGTLRVAIVHHAPALAGLRLGRMGQLAGQAGDEVVELGVGLVAHVPPSCGATRDRLRRIGGELERLLPPGSARSIEFGPRAVTLLVDDELAIGQQGAADRGLQALAAALAPLPPEQVVRLHDGGPRRCAYCHDDVDERASRCPGCATALHAECLAELRTCPTAGCIERRLAA